MKYADCLARQHFVDKTETTTAYTIRNHPIAQFDCFEGLFEATREIKSDRMEAEYCVG